MPHWFTSQKEALARAGLQAALLSGSEISDCDLTLPKLVLYSFMSGFQVS